jgi:hypothetical protein
VRNPLVRYSRAGDVFHYRWAARRCLRLLDLNSPLECITIEGSREDQPRGEYVIDVAEYSHSDSDGLAVDYFQLKHSTVRRHRRISFGELRDTLKGFADRQKAALQNRSDAKPAARVTFSVVTNRSVAQPVKDVIHGIAAGASVDRNLRDKLQKLTDLHGDKLQNFCSVLRFVDGEGDYVVQKEKLHSEVTEYIAGFIGSHEVDKLIALVQDRALPSSTTGEIYREHVLSRLGVASEQDLFPAPPRFETLTNFIRREQHDEILKLIETTDKPLLIHAPGGVGKTVVARQLAKSLPSGSFGVVYDCFGGGTYRNASQPRHRASDGLIQIANELAVRGYCRTLIGPNQSADALFRAFLIRLAQAEQSLREVTPSALVAIFIDAADNAEMAAADAGETSFVRFFLRERLPQGCRLVVLCRTERVDLLDPPARVTQYPLNPFSSGESTIHLRHTWPGATDRDGVEFHRLTGGNPRVQATVLAIQHRSVDDLLASLGPIGTTVDEQIGAQLAAAVEQIKDRSPGVARTQINSICGGLANFPPFIPIEVLAHAADVHISTVRSFVSDLGRPLWLTDDSVQFRDEPTETWFRNTFSAAPEQIAAYARAVQPLAKKYAYVSRSLPQLLLRAGEYQQLIQLALSDDLLPHDNPIDERNVRVYRLQFAFRAALKLKRYADAARLALRAAEEVAGDTRQTKLLQDNIDIVALLQDAHRVQELAYGRKLAASWEGSANVYAAALLSSVADFKGEARAYLRAAQRWLYLYFEERKKRRRKDRFYPEELSDDDLVEFAWASLNLFGAAECAKSLVGWRPVEVIFRITRLLVRRLLDAERYDDIEHIGESGSNNIYLVIALADELVEVGRYPNRRVLSHALRKLANEKTRIALPADTLGRSPLVPAIISFAEACAAKVLAANNILAVLGYYFAEYASPSLVRDAYRGAPDVFLRAAALRRVLNGEFTVDPRSLLPPKTSDQDTADRPDAGENTDLCQTLDGLFPWYMARATLLCGSSKAVDYRALIESSQRAVSGRHHRVDRLPQYISAARFALLVIHSAVKQADLDDFIDGIVRQSNDAFHLGQRLSALRVAVRQQHLISLRSALEVSARRTIETLTDEGPEQRAESWVELARAILPVSKSDSAAYFDLAIEAVSKFGDEVVQRWEALVSLANQAATVEHTRAGVVYRFFRVAEMVGDTVGREKYWDRDDVFRVGIRLAPAAALAALSRWRDRHVGFLPHQILSLISEAVTTGVIEPDVGWCFSGFFGCYGSSDFAVTCISKAPTDRLKQAILDSAIQDLELHGPSRKDALVVKKCVDDYRLDPAAIEMVLNGLNEADDAATEWDRPLTHFESAESNARQSVQLLHGLNLTTADGITEAVKRFDDLDNRTAFASFWREIVRRVPADEEARFLDALLGSETVDVYDVACALQAIPDAWSQKIAIKRGWRRFARNLGRRFPLQFSSTERLHHWFPVQGWDDQLLAALREGAIEGLAESVDVLPATTLFGFVISIANSLTPEEAADVLEFGIARFELHIVPEYGDGVWSEWLRPPQEMSNAVAGFIWSALGSPDSAERWQAAHCVRRLVAFSCCSEITSLVQWLQAGKVGAFGSHEFPFYGLHSALYLLIAMSRAAIDNPDPLRPHAEEFADIALSGIRHVLIQRAAASIAVSIENALPGTYAPALFENLRRVGRSQFPLREVNEDPPSTPLSLLLAEHPVPKLHLAWDFDDYWFNQLAGLFAVDKEELIELAKVVAVHDLRVSETADYSSDGRKELWNSGSYGYWATSHDHGSYPRVDDYSFYYSYHAFFCVAARLLNSFPVVRRVGGYWEDHADPWDEWLSRHWLTRSDGRWLFDRRDPTPLKRRQWLTKPGDRDWPWSVTAEDFFDCVVVQTSMPGSICVAGSWLDHQYYSIETIRISSALVTRETVLALATAMRTCEHPYNCRLPSYRESDAEETYAPFELTGWIVDPNGIDTRLDAFDPHAREIHYPPLEVGESFAVMLDLTADREKRHCRQGERPDILMKSETWSEEKTWRRGEREEPHRHGIRLCASITLLKQLCAVTNKDLIIEVQIARRQDKRYSTNEFNYGYLDPSHKVFVFSSDGVLKDAGKSYQVG